MSDTKIPDTASVALGPRLARLVGSNPDADQRQVLLRPAMPGVPVIEDRFSEPDQLYAPPTDDVEVTPEEPRISQFQTMVKEEPAPSKTVADTPLPRNSFPESEPQIKATPPNAERNSGLLDNTSKDQAAPQSRALRPPPVITRILAEKADSQSRFQPDDTPAPTISEPPQAPHEKTEIPREPATIPAKERIVERVIKPVSRENMPQLNKTSYAPDKAPEEPTDILPIRPETVEMATKSAQPEQAKDKPHAPDITPVETPSKPTEQPAPGIIPAQAAERVQPSSPIPLTAKTPDPKLPVRVEIGALNITLRQPDPPSTRPALSIARKAPRAHTIPLRGFGED